MKIVRVIIFYVLPMGLAVAAFFPGEKISMSEQWPLYEALRTTASIIFAVIGAWLALIYPRALEKVLGQSKSAEGEARNFWHLLRPLLYSTFILAWILVFGLIRSVVVIYPIFFKYQNILRGCAFSVLVFLTLLQIWTLILTLVPGELLKDELSGHLQRKQFLENLRSRAQRNKES